jgi:hypothetical protein
LPAVEWRSVLEYFIYSRAIQAGLGPALKGLRGCGMHGELRSK